MRSKASRRRLTVEPGIAIGLLSLPVTIARRGRIRPSVMPILIPPLPGRSQTSANRSTDWRGDDPWNRLREFRSAIKPTCRSEAGCQQGMMPPLPSASPSFRRPTTLRLPRSPARAPPPRRGFALRICSAGYQPTRKLPPKNVALIANPTRKL